MAQTGVSKKLCPLGPRKLTTKITIPSLRRNSSSFQGRFLITYVFCLPPHVTYQSPFELSWRLSVRLKKHIPWSFSHPIWFWVVSSHWWHDLTKLWFEFGLPHHWDKTRPWRWHWQFFLIYRPIHQFLYVHMQLTQELAKWTTSILSLRVATKTKAWR